MFKYCALLTCSFELLLTILLLPTYIIGCQDECNDRRFKSVVYLTIPVGIISVIFVTIASIKSIKNKMHQNNSSLYYNKKIQMMMNLKLMKMMSKLYYKKGLFQNHKYLK